MKENHEIGAYEAKTKLPEFLRRVVAGGRFTITQRGKPVAALVPVPEASSAKRSEAARRMRGFMDKCHPTQSVDIKKLIEEGRD